MKLAELFVEITGHDAPLNRTLANAHRGLLGFARTADNSLSRLASGVLSGAGTAMGAVGHA